MDRDPLRDQVARISWWHTIDLGNGIVTPGHDNSPEKLKAIGLPETLQGLSVLDIGAADGFFSFEAERRGASRVLATDIWSGEDCGVKAKHGFDLARNALRSNVESMSIDVMDMTPDKVGVFDLVIFLGVLYHMRHPLLTLERVFSVTKNQLILETQIDMLDCDRPSMAFYPGAELNNDPSNWWGPNPAAVEAMLKTVGFREVRVMAQHTGRPHLGKWQKLSRSLPFLRGGNQGRAVFHAWR